MGGTVGEVVESGKERARQYKREKLDKMTRDAQAKIGEQSGGLYRTSTQALDKLQEFGEDVGDFIHQRKDTSGSEQSVLSLQTIVSLHLKNPVRQIRRVKKNLKAVLEVVNVNFMHNNKRRITWD